MFTAIWAWAFPVAAPLLARLLPWVPGFNGLKTIVRILPWVLCLVAFGAGVMWLRSHDTSVADEAARVATMQMRIAELEAMAAKQAADIDEAAQTLAWRARTAAEQDQRISQLQQDKQELLDATPDLDRIILPADAPWVRGKRAQGVGQRKDRR